MPTLSSSQTASIIIVLAVVSVVSLILALVAWLTASAAGRKFRRYKAVHETADLDAVYSQTLEEVERLRLHLERAEQRLADMEELLQAKTGTPRVIRYQAFPDSGSDLSFSVALLDENQNGVVISSIYGREESRTYAKPVESGESLYPLTEEEVAVIESTEPIVSARVLARQ